VFAIGDIPRELGVTVETLELPEQGMTSEVAIAGDVVIKRAVDPRYIGWLRRERMVLETIAGCELPVPGVRGYVDRGDDVWLAIGRLPGTQFPAALEKATPDRRRRLAQALGALLRRVHDTPVPEGLRSETPWDDRMIEQARGNLGWCDGTPELLNEMYYVRPAGVPARLIHGDLGLDNVLVDGDRLYLIDWPLGDHGDPRFDIAIALTLRDGCPFSADEIEAFYRGYQAAPIDRATLRWFEELWDFF
jgi:aminoglycoside phosphotransferase (APT) family kinase protein